MRVKLGFSWSLNEWGIPFALSVYRDNGHFQIFCAWVTWSQR